MPNCVAADREQASLAALLADGDRSRRLVLRAGELTLDASRVDHAVMAQLVALAGQAHLPQKIAALCR